MPKKNGTYHRLGEPGGPGCQVVVLPISFKDSDGKQKEGELLDAGDKASELELLRTVATRSGVKWGHDEFGWWAVTPNFETAKYSVWRQDDNGNKYLVEDNLSEENANVLVQKLEDTGHKQTYWIESSKRS